MSQKMTLEICVDSLELAEAAANAGADRIELCGHLHDGGITPSAGLIQAARKRIDIPLAALVRPRTGTFSVSQDEFEVMRQEVLFARNAGIDVVVLGILSQEGQVDIDRVRRLVELARPMQVTFHRAFDTCPNLEDALAAVLATGTDRILTSGGSSSAVTGAPVVDTVRKAADGKIALMLCGGISTATIQRALARSGVHEVHASLRSSTRQKAGANQNHSTHLEHFTDRVRELKRLMMEI